MKPTKQTIDLYSAIGWLAMVAVPIAPMIYFGWRVYSSVLAETGIEWLAILAAGVTAVGLEITGVLAGHRAMAFWRLGDIRRATLAGCILGAYILIGVYELSNGFEEITIGATVFVIAPLVYLLVALGEVLEHEAARETAVNESEAEQQAKLNTFNLEEQAKNNAHQREMERQEKADQTAVKLARLQAKQTESKPKPEKVEEKQEETIELSGKALEIYNALVENPRASNTEIGEVVNVSRQYVGQVRRELNGKVKETS